jgi:conjugative relaxase-like TrwC/TraI family protein
MLTISQPLSSSQAQRYHAEEFTSRSQAYYAEGEQVRGEWQGRLAEHFGLRGEVRDDQFKRMAEGRHPWSGAQLVEQRLPHSHKTDDGKTVSSMGHRAGWDATFSAPKSVSVTALVGNDLRVREAHREAVRVAVNEVEKYVQARIGGNRPPETTRSWAAAKFEHDTSRPVGGYSAPQLHTHVVFFNMTKTEGGEYRAMQPRQVFKSQQYGTAVYRAELSSRLRNLGYELQVDRNGSPEIKGYSREYLEANSLRSQQIRDHLKAAGLEGAGPAQIAAHRTREAKIDVGRDYVKGQHRELATRFGNEPDRVVREAHARGTRHEQDPSQHARAAVTYARDKTFEREAVVDRRDLMKEALKRAYGNASFDHVKHAFDDRVRTGQFVQSDRQRQGAPSERYTTPAMIANERHNIEFVREGQDKHQPLISNRIREEAGRSPLLNAEQQRAVKEILASKDKVVGFQGIAGSGKTTTLREIRIAAQRDGYKVQGFAPTSRATAQLQEAGIRSSTLQRHLAEPRTQSTGRNLYVVDESSLVSTKQTRELFERMGPNDRAVLVGDARQHQSVEAGRPFQQLQQAGMKTANLDEVVRQNDPSLRQVVRDLADGRVREAFSQLREQGRIRDIPDRGQRLDAIAKDFAKSPDRTLVISPDNHTRQDLNTRIRQELKERGDVSGPDQKVQVLVLRQDMTGADRAWAAQYREGDVIRYTKGSEQHSIKPGEYATVRDIDARQNTLRVETKEGRQIEYDPRRLRGVSVYEKAERNFSVGDRVQLTAPNRASGLANRELAKIERISPSGDVHIRTDTSKTAAVRGDHKHLDHGYAVTSHSAQGTTADRVIVHAEGGQSSALVNQRFAYVSGSRMREGLQVYTDDSHHLESSLSRRFDKSAAVGERAISQGSSRGESGASQSTKAPGHSQTQAGSHHEMGHAP